MTYVYWIMIGILVIAILFGIKDLIQFISNSFANNGIFSTILLIIFIALFVTPSFIKDYAPKYYGLSIWSLILFIGGFLIYRQLKVTHKQED